MITIEHLDVTFDAEQGSDEHVFAGLFARYIARHDEQRARDDETEQRARSERTAYDARSVW
jgi:predicted alpha-1,6-mannanase (GH76 family)